MLGRSPREIREIIEAARIDGADWAPAAGERVARAAAGTGVLTPEPESE